MQYDPDDTLLERLSVPFGEYIARYLRDDDEFMAGVRRGLKERREGRLIPWSEVKRELGLGAPD